MAARREEAGKFRNEYTALPACAYVANAKQNMVKENNMRCKLAINQVRLCSETSNLNIPF
jgi:hypothetical protein